MKQFTILLVFLFLAVLFHFLVKKIEKKLLFRPITCKSYDLIQYKPHSILLQKHIFISKKKENLVIFCHGNAGNLNLYSHFIDRLAKEEDFDILVPEYPEYGIILNDKKEKPLNRHNCIQNVLDAYFTVQRETSVNKKNTNRYKSVFFFGFSLGTSIATQCVRLLEKDTSVKGLVLINGFSSYKTLMQDILGNFYTKLLPLSFEDFNTKKYAEEVAILKPKDFKVCLVHTMKDSLIPWKHSKTLFDAFEGVHRKHILIRHGDHNLGPVQFFEEWFPSTALFLLS